MHKEQIKRFLPGWSRPFVIRLLGALNRLANLRARLRMLFLPRASMRAVNLARRDKRIVFVAERPSWREAKLAHGLKRAGWDVIQLFRRAPLFADMSDFAELQQFSSPAHAAELAYKTKTRAFHIFAPICDDTCVELINQKPGRVIVDFYDDFYSIADGLPEMEAKYAVDIAKQAFCIGGADALCARDMQLQYRRKATGVGRNIPVINFPEYCWDRTELRAPRGDGQTHIVQIGYMGFEARGENDVACFQVIRAFVEAGCHFHIYMHPSFPAIGSSPFNFLFRDYLKLASDTGRIHIHPTLPPDQLISALTQYDFGFNMLNGGTYDNIPWTRMNAARLPYCGSSRLFDYLDAGLGMLVDGTLSYMRHTFGPYGVIFDGTELVRTGQIPGVMKRRPSQEQIFRARRALSITENVHRLTKFYSDLF